MEKLITKNIITDNGKNFWREKVSFILENFEKVTITLEIEEMNMIKETKKKSLFRKDDSPLKYIYLIENSRFRIRKDELQGNVIGLASDNTFTNEERLKAWNDIAQVAFDNQDINNALLEGNPGPIFMLWDNDDDMTNTSYDITEDEEFLYINVESKVYCKNELKEIKKVDRVKIF